MNITLTGTKITQDNKFLAFEKNNDVDVINITVDTDNEWAYKLDVRYPDKCCAGGGNPLYNIINLTRNGNICTAILTSDMLPFSGKYVMQLRAINDDKVYHSDTFDCWVKYSIEPVSTYDPVPSEFYQIEQNITEINNHPPKPGENGYWLIWDITTQQYKESDIPLPDGTLPNITADTSGKYLSNDGKKAYWAEVQVGEENKIDAIEVNRVEQPIVDKTVNITVPTKTSDLSNDSGYITNEALDDYATKAELPTKVSQLENDSKFINESALDGYAKTANIPTKTSQLDNDSGYITANDVPVKSVDGATGDVVTNAVKTTVQTLTDAQKQQARINIGAGTSSFDGDYNSLTNKPTIPTKTSDITNDSGFITETDIPVKSVNGKTGEVTLDAKSVGALPDTTVVPSKTSELDNDNGYITESALGPYAKTENIPTQTSQLDNDSGFITNAALDGYAKTTDVPTKVSQLDNDSKYITSSGAPVQSVNGKTGTVVLDATSVGALADTTPIPSKTSELDNDSGFITSAPVTSVNTKTGVVELDYADVEAAPTIQGTELIKGTQTETTNLWTGVSTATTLYDGKIIDYYLPYNGNGASVTLTLTLSDGTVTMAIPVKMRGTREITTHFTEKSIIHMVYVEANNCWQCQAPYWEIYYSGVVRSSATTLAKTANFTNFALKDNSWVQINMVHGNRAAKEITLNINNTGAKPIYINGLSSSDSNYELPAGTYFVFYDGTAYQFRTDSYLYGTVPSTRKVNNKQLSMDITLTASDVGALPADALPAVTTADNGKVLCVVDGKWAAVTLSST